MIDNASTRALFPRMEPISFKLTRAHWNGPGVDGAPQGTPAEVLSAIASNTSELKHLGAVPFPWTEFLGIHSIKNGRSIK